MKTKRLSALLSALLVLGLLAGCGNTAAASAASAASSEPAQAAAPETAQPIPPAEASSAQEAEASWVDPVPAELDASQAQQLEEMQNLHIENPYTFPLTDEDMTVTMWCDLIPPLFNAMPNGMSDNLAIQELQKRTGITLDITSTAITSAADTVSLLVASGDFPEIWSARWTMSPPRAIP